MRFAPLPKNYLIDMYYHTLKKYHSLSVVSTKMQVLEEIYNKFDTILYKSCEKYVIKGRKNLDNTDILVYI